MPGEVSDAVKMCLLPGFYLEKLAKHIESSKKAGRIIPPCYSTSIATASPTALSSADSVILREVSVINPKNV